MKKIYIEPFCEIINPITLLLGRPKPGEGGGNSGGGTGFDTGNSDFTHGNAAKDNTFWEEEGGVGEWGSSSWDDAPATPAE